MGRTRSNTRQSQVFDSVQELGGGDLQGPACPLVAEIFLAYDVEDAKWQAEMPTEIDPIVLSFVQMLNLSKSNTKKLSYNTSLQDLGLIGDDIVEAMEILRNKWGVNMDRFDPRPYTPGEFTVDIYVMAFLPWTKSAQRRMAKYRPITLRMVKEAIDRGIWPETGVATPT